MSTVLIYFKEEHLEFCFKKQNSSAIEVSEIPLYFLAEGYEISMGAFARSKYFVGDFECYGGFWRNIIDSEKKITRNGDSIPLNQILFYALKESVFPKLLQEKLGGVSLQNFISQNKFVLFFDPFVTEDQRAKIFKGLQEITGLNSKMLFSFDYWEIFRGYYEKNQKINTNEIFINLSTACNDLYINLISKNPPYIINQSLLSGKGSDPRLDAILSYLANYIRKIGSTLSLNEIKNLISEDAKIVLSKLSNGLINHNFNNPDLKVAPFKLSFNAGVINTAGGHNSLHLNIRNELDSFVNSNKLSSFKLFLSGAILNQIEFVQHFKQFYSQVITEDENISIDLKNYLFEFVDHFSIPQVPELPKPSEITQPPEIITKSKPTPPPLPGLKPIAPDGNKKLPYEHSPKIAKPVITIPPPPVIPAKKSDNLGPKAEVKGNAKPVLPPVKPDSDIKHEKNNGTANQDSKKKSFEIPKPPPIPQKSGKQNVKNN